MKLLKMEQEQKKQKKKKKNKGDMFQTDNDLNLIYDEEHD